MFEIFYPHLETILCIATFAAFLCLFVTWYLCVSVGGKLSTIVGVITICLVIVVYLVGCAMIDRVDQNLAIEKNIVVLDKWNENNNYYFAEKEGIIYMMEYDLRDNENTIQYSKLPRIRFKNLEVGRKYTIEYYSRSNILRSIQEK